MTTPEELKTFQEMFKGRVIILDSIQETIEKEKKFISFLHHKIKVHTKFIEHLKVDNKKNSFIFDFLIFSFPNIL